MAPLLSYVSDVYDEECGDKYYDDVSWEYECTAVGDYD